MEAIIQESKIYTITLVLTKQEKETLSAMLFKPDECRGGAYQKLATSLYEALNPPIAEPT